MYSTSMINFEGCSLIFVMPKARKYLGMFTYPLATNSKFSKTKLFQLVHKGAQIECFKGKYGLKSCETVPLRSLVNALKLMK